MGERLSLAVDVVFVAVVEVLILAVNFGCCIDSTGSVTTSTAATGCPCCMMVVEVKTCSTARSDPDYIRRSTVGVPKLSRCCAVVLDCREGDMAADGD